MLENSIQKTRLKQWMPELSKNFLDYMDEYQIEDYVNDSFSFLTGSKRCQILALMNEAFQRGLSIEVQNLREKYKSMPTDGGRYKTAADVLEETIGKY